MVRLMGEDMTGMWFWFELLEEEEEERKERRQGRKCSRKNRQQEWCNGRGETYED